MQPPTDRTEIDRQVRACLPDLLRTATRLTGDLHLAEELVQEALHRRSVCRLVSLCWSAG